ncbi:MAG: matrixin family metalloprotease [Nitrosopumilaceae archaeon]|nr:matrixin family metalloprotease [Nitrosopumilaceae archaeon]NIP09372.1 matrixin family metalloprotease [Nitrosopumilaceae archaeon]NIS94602.1 matrixin family metalloprotease [Nitrosopumilaceae archaeon]
MVMYSKIIGIAFFSIILLVINPDSDSYAQESSESKLFDEANELFTNGQYGQAIMIYDRILEKFPNNSQTLKLKGIANSNLGNHQESLKQFFVVLQNNSDDVLALTGMGVGFGNLGEYHEAKYYFDTAIEKKPDSIVIKNYKEFVDKVISKYPYTPTEKPGNADIKPNIPDWIKSIARWWSENKVQDEEFVNALEFLIQNKIIQIELVYEDGSKRSEIPFWVKQNAGWWAEEKIEDSDFVAGIQYMMENQIIQIQISDSIKINQKDQEFLDFEKYLREITNNINDEKRYIEYPNPSADVIKKFLRDYNRWNFEEEVSKGGMNFPDPDYEVFDSEYHILYKVFVNEQPSGLPLDHVSTLEDSFEFWKNTNVTLNNRQANIEFEIIREKHEANVWVTWVVRDLGQGVLGHANFGKGIVEVTLGDYNCDGSFQLYDVSTVQKIMTHELGHSIGLPHVTDPDNIMYQSMSPKYAYCLIE